MKCFVIGSTGFIGKNLVEQLKGCGLESEAAMHEVFCPKRDEVISMLHIMQPDIIYYCAGDIYDESNMFGANVKLLYDVLITSLDINYKKFIYIGAGSEYGIVSHARVECIDMILPGDLYEATKGCGTLLCQGIARSKLKPIIILRPFTLYGKYEKKRRLIPTMFSLFNSAVDGESYLGLDPFPRHDWVYIDDLIDVLIKLIHIPIIFGDIINIGTGVQSSNQTVLQLFNGIVGNLSYKATLGLRNRDQENYMADTSYAQIQYGIECSTSLKSGLIKLNEIWKQNANIFSA
jgi:nucleoside-diphosphate-sugar epimerase